MSLPPPCSQPLVRIPEPFNDPEWIFELKLDGFRALAYVENGRCRLVSRNGHTFKRFDPLCAALAKELEVKNAILDGEIVCLDEEGRSLFNPLLFRKRTPIFAAFDLLWVDGEDLRELPLIERKKRLRRVIPQHDPQQHPQRDPQQHPHLLHVDFVWEKGRELFALACERDLEGVVGKWAKGSYQSDGRSTSWVKIKNPGYSQAEGKAELFEGRGSRANSRKAELILR